MKGTVVVVTSYHGKKKVEEIRFAVKKPDKFWQEGENYTIVSNGKTMWIYDKNKNEVIKINMPKKRPKFDYGEFIKDLLKDNKVKLLGTGKVTGRECYVIEAIPRNKTYYIEQKLWIDKEYWYPLKIEINYGEFNSTIEYRHVKFNTGIPDSFFEFKPPAGARVIEQNVTPPKRLTLDEAQKQVNFTIVTPKYTASFKFKYAYVYKFGGREMVTLFYTKDDQKLVVTESEEYPLMTLPNSTVVNVNGTKFEIAQIFGRNVLRIHKGSFSVTISAKLPKNELLSIGRSIVESKEWNELSEVKAQNEKIKLNISINGTTVFFFYSPFCPHCEAIMPFMKNLTKEYKNVKFDFCNVYNCSGECKQVMRKYNIMFVPTVVVFKNNTSTTLVGTVDIKNKLEGLLYED